MNFTLYIGTLITLCVIDAVWLFTMGGYYRKWLDGLFASSFNFTPAVVFYLLYAVGLIYFIISPALKSGTPLKYVFLTGAFLGLIAYGTYDLTNHSTLKNWPLIVTMLDMAWGAVVSGLTSVIVVAVYNSLHK